MDAKATAGYIERRLSDAVKEANGVRQEVARDLAKPMTGYSHATSSHVLDRLVDSEAIAAAWLEIYEIAGGNLEKVGHEEFLDAVRKVRDEIQKYLRTSRSLNTGISAAQQMAQHNAATKVLATTDVIELIDENEEN
jgi:translation initiation factor 2B subunit (eIF-2B alpha/beta/delta family)